MDPSRIGVQEGLVETHDLRLGVGRSYQGMQPVDLAGESPNVEVQDDQVGGVPPVIAAEKGII
jgi:hypothetical protein